jgi:hypothetical protein
MLKRGDIAMEFNQSKISHRFVITPDGGKIIISALDNQTINQIKTHIMSIQKEFLRGILLNLSSSMLQMFLEQIS